MDQNIVSKYEIDLPRREQAYRKQQGLAAVRYLRHERFFVILATQGRHAFKAGHANQLRDIRKDRLLYGGYSVRYAQAGFKRGSIPRWLNATPSGEATSESNSRPTGNCRPSSWNWPCTARPTNSAPSSGTCRLTPTSPCNGNCTPSVGR